jgi:cell division protein ZapE
LHPSPFGANIVTDQAEVIEPLDAFDAGIQSGRWMDDAAQRAVLTELDRLHVALVANTPDSLFERVLARFTKPKKLSGMYIYGDVGRGKTFLMDLFYQSLPFEEKQRLHFHHFMQMVHQQLNELRSVADPLEIICERFAKNTRVLCFDEFFVSDIGDAMLLSGLLEGLFDRNVCLVTTSNVTPDGLYKDGLQRQRFLPAVALLKQHCRVIKLEAAQDYRLRALTDARIYIDQSAIPNSEASLQGIFDSLVRGDVQINVSLDIEDRIIIAKKQSGDVVWFDFQQVCEGPRSAADYIEIAREFQTVLLSDVPLFNTSNEDAARRFMFLIDEFYDRKVNLILSAAVAPTALYQGQKFQFEFARTASRLIEMQTKEYLAAGHVG